MMQRLLTTSHRSALLGSLLSIAIIVSLSLLLIPFRTHFPPASIALMLVVPLVAGIAVGGLAAGVVATVLGFLAYDLFFIAPYGTLAVGSGSNWIPLVVYVLVGLVTVLLDRRFRRQRERAIYHAQILERLATFPTGLISGSSSQEVSQSATAQIVSRLDLAGAMILRPDGTTLKASYVVGDMESADAISARFTDVNGIARVGPSAIGQVIVRSFSLATMSENFGLLVVWAPSLPDALVKALEVVASQVSAALERTQLREARLKLDTLEQIDGWRASLLRTVSHDLLTPLAGIKTATTTLNDLGDGLEDQERDLLFQTALVQIDRSIQLVSDLLNVTRIEAGAFHLQYQRVSLEDLVIQVAAGVDFLSVDSKLELDVVAGLPLATVDVGLIREAVWNLLDNAVRHSPIGGVVRLSIVADDHQFCVEVTDCGQLAAGADQIRLFDWFHAVGSSGRSGLGLAIARSFVEAHGGELAVMATSQGTSFRFTIPREP